VANSAYTLGTDGRGGTSPANVTGSAEAAMTDGNGTSRRGKAEQERQTQQELP